MEIKTLSEMRDARVIVRVQESEHFEDSRIQVVVNLPSATAYDPERAAEVMAENYDRARRRVELMKEAEKGYQFALRELQDQLTEEQSARRRAEIELRTLQRQVETRFSAAEVEAAKADARAEARASEGARVRSEIRGLLNRPGVEEAMNQEQDQRLAQVIRQVRALLDN